MDVKILEQYRHNMDVQKIPQFTIIDSTGVLREYPLYPEKQSRLVIGRSTECDIRVECSGISNLHGKFKWINGKLYYADMGSTNGTYIHKQGKLYFEQKSRNYIPLADGDFISIHGRGNQPCKEKIIRTNHTKNKLLCEKSSKIKEKVFRKGVWFLYEQGTRENPEKIGKKSSYGMQ